MTQEPKRDVMVASWSRGSSGRQKPPRPFWAGRNFVTRTEHHYRRVRTQGGETHAVAALTWNTSQRHSSPRHSARRPTRPRHSALPPQAQRPQASWVKNSCFFPSEHTFLSWENDGSRSWGWSACEEQGLEPCGSHGGAGGHTPSIHTWVFPFYFSVNSAGLTLLGETCFEKFLSKGQPPLTFAQNTCLESAREAKEGRCWRLVGMS